MLMPTLLCILYLSIILLASNDTEASEVGQEAEQTSNKPYTPPNSDQLQSNSYLPEDPDVPRFAIACKCRNIHGAC